MLVSQYKNMNLHRINYEELNGKQKEIYNFQKVSAELADYGFNCIKLADDWQGADFLAYHKDGKDTLKVQLKGRLTISKKYIDKEIFMAFPFGRHWYLISHESLVGEIRKNTKWLETDSWINGGEYSSAKPSKRLLEAISHAKL